MLLIVEGAVVSRSTYTSEKGKVYPKVSFSAGGQLVHLDCTQAVYDRAGALLLKDGEWGVTLDAREFQGRTSFTASDISPLNVPAGKAGK